MLAAIFRAATGKRFRDNEVAASFLLAFPLLFAPVKSPSLISWTLGPFNEELAFGFSGALKHWDWRNKSKNSFFIITLYTFELVTHFQQFTESGDFTESLKNGSTTVQFDPFLGHVRLYTVKPSVKPQPVLVLAQGLPTL